MVEVLSPYSYVVDVARSRRHFHSFGLVPECFMDVPGLIHSILLVPGFKTKRLHAYRVPQRLKPEVDRQVQEVLVNGIISPSHSPMASPLVCVLKGKEGC